MPEAIADFSPEAVIEAIEGNLVDSSAAFGRTEEGVVFRGTDVAWVYTGFPSLSRVLGAPLPQEEVEDRVAEILSYFKRWDAAVSWVVGPTSWPPRLGDYLHKSGFGISDSWIGMAMDLSSLPMTIDRPIGVEVQAVTSDAELRAWATLSTDPTARGDAEGAVDIFSPEHAGSDRHCRYYLGYRNGAPVSRIMTYTRGKTVGVYWMATLAQHRGLGITTAVIHHALEQAAASGTRIAVMPSTPKAQSLGIRLGFKPYCQFNVYTWPPSPLRMPTC